MVDANSNGLIASKPAPTESGYTAPNRSDGDCRIT
jgi:hypothetical protein